MRTLWSDARHFQIAALSSLLLINFFWIDFGAKPLYSALAIAAALLTQIVCTRLSGSAKAGLRSIDLRSPLITGLSLSLLLRANEPWLPALAGIAAIASKFLLRVDGTPHFQSRGICHRPAVVAGERRVDFAGPVGHQHLAGVIIGVSRASGAASCAALGHRAVLSWRPWRIAVGARTLARRSARHSAASDAERVALDLRLFHDLRSENDARLRAWRALLFALAVAALGALSRILHADAAGACMWR